MLILNALSFTILVFGLIIYSVNYCKCNTNGTFNNTFKRFFYSRIGIYLIVVGAVGLIFNVYSIILFEAQYLNFMLNSIIIAMLSFLLPGVIMRHMANLFRIRLNNIDSSGETPNP